MSSRRSLTTRVNTFPTIDTRGHAISTLASRDNTLPPITTRGYGSPTLPAQFLQSQTVTSQPDIFPSWSLPFVASTHVYTRPVVSVRVPTSSSTDAIPLTPTRFPLATSRVSSFLDRPAMSSGASNIVNPSTARNVYGSSPWSPQTTQLLGLTPLAKTIRVLQPQLALPTFGVLHLPLCLQVKTFSQ